MSPKMSTRYYMQRMAAHAELSEQKVTQIMEILDLHTEPLDNQRMDKILAIFNDDTTYELLQSHAMRDVREWEMILAN